MNGEIHGERNMKTSIKITGIALCAALIFCLLGCGAEKSVPVTDNDVSVTDNDVSANEDAASFELIDSDGGTVTLSDYSDKKLIMINMFESWCGPCAAEMPELEKLYNDYKERGFVILGVYTGSSEESEVRELVGETGVTYPVLKDASGSLAAFDTGYVPTTVFMRPDGTVLGDEPVVGAKSYEEWETIVLGYLG